MTVIFTVISGTLIFVLGQIVLKLIIEPIQEFNKTISKISYDLVRLANVFANPKPLEDEKMAEACKIMREHSSNLHAYYYLVPAFHVTSKIFKLPDESQVIAATKELIGLSNGHDHNLANQGILNSYTMQKIKKNLGIKIPEGELLDEDKELHFIKAK